MRTVLGVRERGCIAVDRLQDLELNSDYLKLFSESLHLIWPSAPAVVMCRDRIVIILPPCPVTSKQGVH